jgi:hypothetical protein
LVHKVYQMRPNLTKGMGALILLSCVQAALRVFFAVGLTGYLGMEIQQQIMGMVDSPLGDWTMTITLPFFMLGVSSAVSVAGLLLNRNWGLYGTVVVSLITIAYDLWATFAIQPSALFGIVIPTMFSIYLIGVRGRGHHRTVVS